MKVLSKCVTAGAAALLMSAGLGSAAYAAPQDCVITIADTDPAAAPEGNEDTSGNAVEHDRKFTVTGTDGGGAGCDGVVVDYTFGGTATIANADQSNDFDYVDNGDGTVTLDAAGTAEIVVTVLGDLDNEADETITVTLTEDDADASLGTKSTGQTTVTDDDPGIGAGGALTISPSTGDAGTVINVSGTACEADTVDVFLGASQGQSGDTVAERNDVPVADDGTFKTTLTVPAGSDPDSNYVVGADCGVDSYEVKSFDVTGPSGTNGYRMVAADGGIFTFGEREFWGSTGSMVLNKPIVGGATDTSDYEGYWIVASDGGVFTFSAEFHGSLADRNITSPAVEIEPTPTGKGYWIVQADGTVTAFGDAKHVGDFKGKPLNKPVIGMAVTPTGGGYWLVAEDGGIFNFGDAKFFGSTGDKKLNAPIVDLAPAVDNEGYYLLGRDGGVFTFGSADFKGSTGSMTLNAPVIAMLTTPSGNGYWLAASDGGIFTFGAGAEFLGSMGGTKLNSPVLDLIN